MLCGITYCVPVLCTSSQTTLSPAAELQSRADRPGTVSTRRCFFCLTTVLTFTYKSAFLRHKAAPNTTVPMSLSSRCYGEDYQEHNHCAVRKKTPLPDSTSWVYLTDFTNDENWKVALLQWSCQLSPFTQWSAEPRCESKLPFYSSQLWMWTTSRREDEIRLSSDWNKHLCEHQLICCDGDRIFTPHNSPGDGRMSFYHRSHSYDNLMVNFHYWDND